MFGGASIFYMTKEIRWCDIWIQAVLAAAFTDDEINDLVRSNEIEILEQKVRKQEKIQILFHDIPSARLTAQIRSLLAQKHPEKPTYEYAKEILGKISAMSQEQLSELYISISANQTLKSMVRDGLHRTSRRIFSTRTLQILLLEELYSAEPA